MQALCRAIAGLAMCFSSFCCQWTALYPSKLKGFPRQSVGGESSHNQLLCRLILYGLVVTMGIQLLRQGM
jgi:hypothetical protein